MKQYDVYDEHVQETAKQFDAVFYRNPCKVIEYCYRFARRWNYNQRLFYKDVVEQIEWNCIPSAAFA